MTVGHLFKAAFRSTCSACGGAIGPGDEVAFVDTDLVCADCRPDDPDGEGGRRIVKGVAQVRRTLPRPGVEYRNEHHWTLVGPCGVLTFCVIETPNSALAHARVDGTPWYAWGIDAHIPADACANTDPGHAHAEHGECGLLDGAACCVSATSDSAGARKLLLRWIDSGRDDDVIWAELRGRWDWMVTANTSGGES